MPLVYRSRVPLLLALALAPAGCHDSVSPNTGGTSHVLLTDDPFPYYRLQRVDIYVVSVAASLSADTGGVGSPGGEFVTIATPERRINLLGLQNGVTDELGRAGLPAGPITAVRMVIDTDSSSITLKDGRVLTGTSQPGITWQFGTNRPVLNALIQEQIEVPDSGAVIVIDFDVGQSFILPQEVDSLSTDSGFIFAPQLRAADANRTGSISGVLRAHNSDGAPVADASLQLYFGYLGTPESWWFRRGTATTGADGAFRFGFVTRSSWFDSTWAGWAYVVTADPPPGTDLSRTVVSNLLVEVRQETALGTIVLP